ncbi:unnamed protein product (macronuclear) [Paramecium tetraurelia]|uniref:Uncharacterized protein n=1 Tax=Paramecium tetraurelia TaxID=5888 RepID=A0DSX7_PARTE|nr:uncharacterized protein GSPATT00019837001 [Paramecium tetraurelia]CAK86144.1 unnamed protein product [Paramecium tetraurelia]|eukprot:XP_001453541.1 hypothetical protein (macronuclear) [Paramecium tetraurelia strain d4-2]
MQRKRRCAFDSDNLEEYIQLATIGQNQTNLFYDDKKLNWLNKSKQVDDDEEVLKDIEGFEHNYSSPQVDYIDTQELPPDIVLKSGDDIFSHYIMILGDINEYVKQSLTLFCMQSRKNSSEDFNEELISPIKRYQLIFHTLSKLCLDLAVKRIQEKNGVHIVKFLMHDMTIQNYGPIINVYFLQTSNYILIINIDQNNFQAQKEQDMIETVKQKASTVKNVYVLYFTESDIQDQRIPNQYYCNRWNISVILSQIIDQVINQ